MEDFRVTYVPSASILVALHENPIRTEHAASLPLLVFGDAVYPEDGPSQKKDTGGIDFTKLALRDFTLQPLEFSGEEARRIAEIWGVQQDSPHLNLGEQASVERVRELDLTPYRTIHFATHAVLGDEIRGATQPALVLSPNNGGGYPGMLRFSDILDLKLNADLVVLSACNTRLGKLRTGEGLVGLTRAFMYAGADSVVVSLWNVLDQSTSMLMQRFHQRLKDGESKAEALRQAKLDIMKESVKLKATGTHESLASPFFWAPFILVGDWD